MPPKRVAKPKLHELAVELPAKTVVNDPSKRKDYAIGKQFATGGFGRIYTCRESGASTELVIKVEPLGNGPLFTEVNVFQRILKPEMIASYLKSKKIKWIGLPSLISSGVFDYKTEKLRFMVIPKYETSLENIRIKQHEKLTEIQVWNVAKCMVQSLEYIHSKNYVHADIKAANILLERSSDFSTSVLVDYGLARNASSNEDKPDKKRAHNGTAIFTSIDAHRGCHPSYRGDIEILAYNIIYWITGSLPWLAVESAPDKVYTAKKDFLNNSKVNTESLLKEYPSSAAGVFSLFTVASKTAYKDQLNFSDVYKIVDKISTGKSTPVKPVSRKRPSSDEETVGTVSKTMKPAKATTRSEDVRSDASQGKSTAVKPSTSSSVSPKVKKSAPGDATNIDREESVEPLPETSSRKNVTLRSSRLRSRRSAVRVVPGLKTNIRNKETSQDMKENIPVHGSPPSSLDSAEQIDSSTRGSPGKLRQAVPGVRNFPRGRRSIVIQQITRKYRRIATQKTLQQPDE